MKKQTLKKVVKVDGNRFFEHTLSSIELGTMLGGINPEVKTFMQEADSCGCLNCANICCSVKDSCPNLC